MEKWRTLSLPALKKYSRCKILSSYKTQLNYEIHQLPHHLNTIDIHDIYKDYEFKRVTERQKCMLKTYSYNKKRLRREEAIAYNKTWVKTWVISSNRKASAAHHARVIGSWTHHSDGSAPPIGGMGGGRRTRRRSGRWKRGAQTTNNSTRRAE